MKYFSVLVDLHFVQSYCSPVPTLAAVREADSLHSFNRKLLLCLHLFTLCLND